MENEVKIKRERTENEVKIKREGEGKKKEQREEGRAKKMKVAEKEKEMEMEGEGKVLDRKDKDKEPKEVGKLKGGEGKKSTRGDGEEGTGLGVKDTSDSHRADTKLAGKRSLVALANLPGSKKAKKHNMDDHEAQPAGAS